MSPRILYRRLLRRTENNQEQEPLIIAESGPHCILDLNILESRTDICILLGTELKPEKSYKGSSLSAVYSVHS